MKLLRMSMALAALLAVAGLAYVAQQDPMGGDAMTVAADAFVGGLSDAQKEKAVYPFDSKERFNWNFIPLQDKERNPTRKGLPLAVMSAAQKQAALALVKAGTSAQGALAAATIMSLESILLAQEKNGAMVRNPQWYFFTVFGTPAKTGSWGWRVEGHHLSLNFTMDGTRVVAATPHFYGANPAVIMSGPDKGKRILAPTEALAIELFQTFDAEQKKLAHQEKDFPEPEQKSVAPKVGPAVGVPAAKMTAAQQDLLKKLIHSYTERMPPDVAELELKQVRAGGWDAIRFAFTGSTEPGKAHTYRVQGPSFVIEFLNIQADSAGNPANHIHSAWRRLDGDFGTSKKNAT